MDNFWQVKPGTTTRLRGFGQIEKRLVTSPQSFWPAAFFYILLSFAALVTTPFYFQRIGLGLDDGWGFALNHFIHTSYKFGPDLVFTYGPLGFVSVPEHISWNIPVALALRFSVWGILLWQLTGMWRAGRRFGAVALTASLILGNRLYFFYWDYLVAAAILVVIAKMMQQPGGYRRPLLLSFLVAISFLVKPTVYMLALPLVGLYLVSRLLDSRRRPITVAEGFAIAIAFLLGPIAYLLYEPSLPALFEYVKGGLEIAKGFAAAMSLDTDPHDGSLLAGTLLILGGTLAAALKLRDISVAGASMVAVTALVVFRHGFVRSDSSHVAVYFAFVILVFGFLLALLKHGALNSAYIPGFFILICIAVSGVAERWSPAALYWGSPAENLKYAEGLIHWGPPTAELDYAAQLLKPTPIAPYTAEVAGTRVLMFPWQVTYGALGTFDLVPIYVTQAYSAHTRYLDTESAKRIASARPPIDHVVIEWDDIDGRNPLMDLPATWMTLFSDFAPQHQVGNSLLLQRRPQALRLAYQPIGRVEYRREAWVQVPQRATPVAMSIDLLPTLGGSLRMAAYKLAPVELQARRQSGGVTTFRVTADVLSSPSFINCLPLSWTDLTELWSRNAARDPIVALRLTGRGLKHLSGSKYVFHGVDGTAIRVGGDVAVR